MHAPLGNVRLHHGDALEVLARVPDGALSFLYLLHPDPWPKARHAKRRMMNDGPLALFAAKLRPGGELRFGTDHPVYLRHALMVMRRFCTARRRVRLAVRRARRFPHAPRRLARNPLRSQGARPGTRSLVLPLSPAVSSSAGGNQVYICASTVLR